MNMQGREDTCLIHHSASMRPCILALTTCSSSSLRRSTCTSHQVKGHPCPMCANLLNSTWLSQVLDCELDRALVGMQQYGRAQSANQNMAVLPLLLPELIIAIMPSEVILRTPTGLSACALRLSTPLLPPTSNGQDSILHEYAEDGQFKLLH